MVHLHWAGQGFLGPRQLAQFCVPVVWTMHDTWTFTGGCHYPGGCVRYREECGRCPQLGSTNGRDLSWRNLREKKATFGEVAAWIAPSAWLADCAKRSGWLMPSRVHVIPNALAADAFHPVDRAEARARMGMSRAALVLAAGAMDLREERKGCYLLRDTLAQIAEVRRPCVLLLFGGGQSASYADWPVEVRCVGDLRNDAELAQVYQVADALLLPSLQDNLPNVAVEAQACGCPVVGFDSGGLREIIEHGQTGWLSPRFDSAGLASAILEWMGNAPSEAAVAARCAERHLFRDDPGKHAAALLKIYRAAIEVRSS